jgi:hypothetical protein
VGVRIADFEMLLAARRERSAVRWLADKRSLKLANQWQAQPPRRLYADFVSVPQGLNVNSRGCQPTVKRENMFDPYGVEFALPRQTVGFTHGYSHKAASRPFIFKDAFLFSGAMRAHQKHPSTSAPRSQ